MERTGGMREEVEAAIHSLGGKTARAKILRHEDNNHCIVEYEGKICTAIWNPFNGYYYVDDIYGIIRQKENTSKDS